MRSRRFLSTFVAVAMFLIVACGADDAPAVPTSVPSATPVPLPTVPPPPPFNLDDYSNGEEVEHLLIDLGPERPFPPELMDGAPVLANEEAARLWEQFLMNTRTFEVKKDLVFGIGGITSASDNCGGTGEFNTFTEVYSPPDGYFEGASGVWDAIHDEYSEWNRPRLMNPTGVQDWRVFLSRGLSAVGGPTLSPPEGDGIPTATGGWSRGHRELRVFDYPECKEIVPAEDLAPEVWQLLGYDSIKPLPPELADDAPQMSPEDVVVVHKEYLRGAVPLNNLNLLPQMMTCDGEHAIAMNPYFVDGNHYGKRATLKWKDAREVAKNAAWIIWDFDDTPENDNEIELGDPALRNRPYMGAIMLESSSECSLERGEQYIRDHGIVPKWER